MIKKVGLTVFVKFFQLGIGMLMLMLSAKIFGPDGRGIIAGANAMAMTFATFGGISIGRVVVFHIAKSKKTAKEFLSDCCFSILSFCGLISICIYGIAMLMWFLLPSFWGQLPGNFLLLAFINVPILLWSAYSNNIFASLDLLFQKNVITFVVISIYAILSYLGILYFKITLVSFFLIMNTSIALIGIAEIAYLKKVLHFKFAIDFPLLWMLFKDGVKMHMDTIAGAMMSSINLIVINYFLLPFDVGVYQLAQALAEYILVIPMMFGLQFNNEISNFGPDRALQQHQKYYIWVSICMAGLCVITYYIAPFLVIFVSSEKFHASIEILRLLLFSVVFNSFCFLFQPQWAGRGYFKLMSVMTILLGLVGAGSSYLLVAKLGLRGAAISRNIVYFIAGTGNILALWYFLKRANKHEKIRQELCN